MNYINFGCRHSRNLLKMKKFNKPLLLPLTSDLKELNECIKEEARRWFEQLMRENSDAEAFRYLALAVLCLIILFNRRRSGEAGRILLENYISHQKNPSLEEEIRKSLSPLEIKLCEMYNRMEVRGKRGRVVPVLMTPQVIKYIDLLVKCRDDVGVYPDNQFLFPVTGGSLHHLRGYDAIQWHIQLCKDKLKQPGAITATNVRKHVSTLSQLLDLEEKDLDMLSKFLGHDLQIHRDYYRLPTATLQLAKCSKILLAIDQGASNYKGKTLEQIQLEIGDDGK